MRRLLSWVVDGLVVLADYVLAALGFVLLAAFFALITAPVWVIFWAAYEVITMLGR